MNRPIIVAVTAAAVSFGFASTAMAEPFGGMVGNTSVCTAPDGGQTKVMVHSDGSFQVKLPDGSVRTGSATDDGTNVTFTETGEGAGPPVQTPSTTRKVGDTWTVEARGQTQNCTLAAGEQ